MNGPGVYIRAVALRGSQRLRARTSQGVILSCVSDEYS
jgi:hypothetical protein